MERKIEELSHNDNIIGLYDKKEAERLVNEYNIAEAREQGLEQGLEQGASDKSVEIVKKMLEDEIDVKTISKYTNLSVEEIENLK